MTQMYTEQPLINFLNNPKGLFERLEFEFSLDGDSQLANLKSPSGELPLPDQNSLISPSEDVLERILQYSRII